MGSPAFQLGAAIVLVVTVAAFSHGICPTCKSEVVADSGEPSGPTS